MWPTLATGAVIAGLMANSDKDSNTPSPLAITVSAECAGVRLDRFLSEKLREMSRSCIQRMIESGEVQVDGRTTKPGQKLRGQEVITVSPVESRPTELLPEPIPLQILYEDEDLAVIDKPAGLIVHSGAGVRSGTLVNALLHHFGQLSSSGNAQRPGIVHRLDKETSGLMLVAKNNYAHLQLSHQFLSRQVTKIYLALVHGCVEKELGEITSRIGRDRIHRTRMTTRVAWGREACTQYRVLEKFERYCLLRLHIKTGRTHQIRVHLSSIKHPVVGDKLYGAPAKLRVPGEPDWQPTLNRNFLHSSELEFTHPRTQKRMKFNAPLPEELALFLSRLRLKQAR